jgi:hypothetical protein
LQKKGKFKIGMKWVELLLQPSAARRAPRRPIAWLGGMKVLVELAAENARTQ